MQYKTSCVTLHLIHEDMLDAVGEKVFGANVSGANISFTTRGCFMRHHLLRDESHVPAAQ